MILLTFRHGLRAAEICDLQWDSGGLQNRKFARSPGQERHARHPSADWSRATGAVKFGLTAPGFSRMVERAASSARLGIKAHAHMLRHACGYKLANDGIDTRSLQAVPGTPQHSEHHALHCARDGSRFKGFWKD